MNTTPTREQVALAAATYAANEFPSLFGSWFSYEKEFAAELLKDNAFVCTVDYAIGRVQTLMRHNTGMQQYAAQRGVGAKGVASVVGHVVGEWLAGRTTIDAELGTW